MAAIFNLKNRDTTSKARAGELITERGIIKTPVFMSVGTFGAVKTLPHEHLESIGTQIILGNTYHLFLRPGPEIFKEFGGLHNFIKWDKPMLTDSGGFQVFSLPEQRVISEEGVTFRSYIDSSSVFFSPENNIEFQELMGSDIMMALDVCVPSTSKKDVAGEAMERTHRWATRCLNAKKRTDTSLFGIVQGALFEDLRKESAEFISSLGFDGYALGGLAVGESEEEREHFTQFTASLLPENKPRYLMGVGTPVDLVKAIHAGIDMFDCIIPTNHARQGIAYTFSGKKKLRKLDYAKSKEPLDSNCDCFVCKRYTQSYIHQLIKSDEATGWFLLAYHNTYFYERLMERAYEAILNNNYSSFYYSILNAYS